jgi:glycosyltransferase involved in cell wall biosynthesis
MKICYYGTSDLKYTRSLINLTGLKENGVEVILCHSTKPKFKLENSFKKIQFYILFPFSLIYRNIFLLIKGLYLDYRFNYDVIFVGDSSHFEVFGAYLIGKLRNKKVIFDPLLSLYDMYVSDYGTFRNKYLVTLLKLTESFIYKFPDLILAHTYQDVLYFHHTFKIPMKKLQVLYIGAIRPEVINKKKIKKSKIFSVVYSGVFIHLHGVEYILGSAKLSLNDPNIEYIFTGTGPGFDDAVSYARKENLSNVKFLGWISKNELNVVLENANLVLGIFQNNKTMPRCIPNKVFQSISYAKPTISADSPGIRELFKHKENIYLCKSGDAKSLYESIKYLKSHTSLLKKIAVAGSKLYEDKLTPKKIGLNIIRICSMYI